MTPHESNYTAHGQQIEADMSHVEKWKPCGLAVQLQKSYRGFQVGCPKIATRICACAGFSIQNLHKSARMRGFSSQFLDNNLKTAVHALLKVCK
jgi:hypothetical protein